jgi:hypothetical protein
MLKRNAAVALLASALAAWGQRVMAGQAESQAQFGCQKLAQEKQDWD